MSQPVKIAIAGANGRMGRAVAQALEGRSDAVVAARFERPGDAGEGLVARETALAAAEAVIDFTLPEASVALAEEAAANGGPALVIGSTGFSDEQLDRIDAAATKIVIVRSGNYSLGVNMLMGLVRQAAAALPAQDWDIEVFEAHHKRKIDAPSGTALMLGEAAAEGRGINLAKVSDRGRDGVTGPRKDGDIGFSVVRGGGIIGEHSVIFAGESESLTLSHSAIDRGLFARGAIAAAVWVKGKPPGLYDMQDVLGFKK
ncbi:4-hydroxy-tetrahydrodipicolinate reductase [Caulobacter vibrioides]|uniref:4-hydroxy-tetrahydrodipicolinate reductase n=2 Tax=Caulobacter vibrioides TaxID=155892 RepID=DAPB_CAUVC|nr:4-hydroxy-tetrahydrodipicolinate reductase [Caulobacter vibrioides]YP_002519037.3 4-hydroxy-tetrahydrodipicolinate reductase [Caulobacter vibrioides NA1000]Q9A2L1.1 RecName: Full=4-hydroxy-tetrahydrodipicolinate reductase; Short=HTPA reductase [Caulobacter vibrioides CB15]QBQ57424.1 4-hydroxy-tetrahydrodipicolinate reductase [synthetic Caulobacter sp. 'ethensis']AAK25512.1 dihydrodipicolinate reductase [Caulobacter vibrioides CB15]ACL97129.3 4-hydroxy-tetrahydrodipicolinate reductase [Caulo